MDAQTNPTEIVQTKKPTSRALFIVIYEVSIVLGCVLAAFLAPPTMLLKTFLWICAGAIVAANVLLVTALRTRARRPEGEKTITQKKRHLTWWPIIFCWIWLLWELYERYGR